MPTNRTRVSPITSESPSTTRAVPATSCALAGTERINRAATAKLRMPTELPRNGERSVSLHRSDQDLNPGPILTSRLPHFEQRNCCSTAPICFDQFRR